MVNEGKFKRSHRLWALGAATFLTPLMMPAVAQAADAEAASNVGEIVVTATHKSESLQKVAISLQALSPETLEQHQVAAFSDYVNLLPSVSFSTLGPGRSQLFFRGISVGGGQLPTVGVYLDDIPITANGRMPDPHIYDVERVEALSGPQGTLFGSSSLAGTMRIITNKAKIGKFEAGYDVQLNKFGKGDFGQMVEGFVNIPVNDKIAVRLVGFYEHDGGYIDNVPKTLTYTSINYALSNAAVAGKDYNPNYNWGGRASATIELSPDWKITPELTYQYLDSRGSYNYDPRVGDLAVHDYKPTYNIDKWLQASLTIQGKIGDFDLTSATGFFTRRIMNANDYTYYSVTYDKYATADPANYLNYMKFTDKNGNNIDPTQQYLGKIIQRKWTQELRVSTPKSWPFQMTAGGFYQFQKNNNDGSYYISGLSQATGTSGYSPALSSVTTPDGFYIVENDQHYKDGAIFAEANYEIIKHVKLTGGARYFIADNGTYGFSGVWGSAKKSNATSLVTGGRCIDSATNTFIHPYRLSCINSSMPYHQTGETHKASVSWQFTPDKMVYFTYSTGFRPGGGNRLAGAAPYKADTLSNYELGVKTTWGRNLRLNASIYHEDWSGIQYTVVPPGYQGAGVTVNAGNATVDGVEADFSLRLGKLTLSGSGAYNDAKLSSNFCGLVSRTDLTQRATCTTLGVDMAAAKGTRLPRQPKFKSNLTARYETGFGEYESFLQGTFLHQSSSTSDLDAGNDALLGDTPGFESFDFSAGIKRDNWNLEAFINNAFDKRGQLSKNTFCSIQYCSGSSRTYPIKPQIFGLKFGQKF